MKRSGFGTVMAVVLIGLLATILTAVAGSAAVQLRRSTAAADDAQASRLLAAATQIARQQLIENNPQSGPVPTPLGRVELVWRSDAQTRACDVTVDVGRIKRALTLIFDGDRVTKLE